MRAVIQMPPFRFLLAGVLAFAAVPAAAADVFGGAYLHDVQPPFTHDINEDGHDFQIGYRGDRIAGLGPIGGPAPYIFGSINDHGDTSLVAAGLGWRIGGPVYVRPGIGIAIHDGPGRRVDQRGRRTDLGSRVLFEPELAIGTQLVPGIDAELSWVHVSHATLFGRQNPGLDMLGIRLNLHLP
jgi:lipid A 3-O-deacylase